MNTPNHKTLSLSNSCLRWHFSPKQMVYGQIFVMTSMLWLQCQWHNVICHDRVSQKYKSYMNNFSNYLIPLCSYRWATKKIWDKSDHPKGSLKLLEREYILIMHERHFHFLSEVANRLQAIKWLKPNVMESQQPLDRIGISKSCTDNILKKQL